MKNNKAHYLSASLILITICFLSIGFSAFQEPLLIDNVGVTVRFLEDMRITGIQVNASTAGVVSNYEDYNIHNLKAGIYLPNKDSSITYKIKTTNFGNIEMGIFDITGLPSNLTYEIQEYNLKEKLCDINKKCTLGSEKDFYLTIKYKENGYDSSKLNYDFNLNVDFRGFHKIVYINIKNTTNYPKEVMDGDNLEIAFATDIPGKVKLTGSNSYTYNTNILSVNNVKEDLTVDRVFRFYEEILNRNPLSSDCPSLPITTGKGQGASFCKTTDNYGDSYYYRGAVKNNNVKFGGYYWKIIRINGDNTVRMIYNGKVSQLSKPLENGTDDSSTNYTNIGLGIFNPDGRDNAYMGYMYGMVNATSYQDAHANTNSSTAKRKLDSWFLSSGLNNDSNKKYLADNLFCNDRSVYSETLSNMSGGIKQLPVHASGAENFPADTGKGYGKNVTFYGTYYRMRFESLPTVATHYPTLKCINKNDSFTVSDTVNGNGDLTYPIGLITIDEAIFAGSARLVEDNRNYLYTGYRYWAMSPGFYNTTAYMGGMIHQGWISLGAPVTDDKYRYYRPVINIKAETFLKSGDGTINNPYVFE